MKKRKYIIGFCIAIATAVVLLAAIGFIFHKRTYVMKLNDMHPTIKKGQKFVVDFIYYETNEPKKKDIVAFLVVKRRISKSSEEGFRKGFFVKRIVGVPGDNVLVRHNGSVFVNDQPLEAIIGFQPEKFDFPTERSSYMASFIGKTLLLRDNEYFMVGDNSYRSNDSKTFGPVPREDIKGKVVEIGN